MSEKKLLSCPFCGGEAVIKEYISCGRKYYSVGCHNDSCMVEPFTDGFRTLQTAIIKWNTRKPMERIVERLEEQVNSWEKVYNVIKNRGYTDDYTVGAYDGYRNSVTIVKEEGGLNE